MNADMLRTSPEHDVGGEGEQPRKRVRKGTKSCWECKRRKIRCQLSTEDVAVCSGCRARGTSCLSQEFPEEHDSPGAMNVGERLGRVELLLEKIVSKMSQFEEEQEATQIQTPESMGSNDVFTPFTASVPGLFDSNDMVGERDEDVHSIQPSRQSDSTANKKSCKPPSKTDRLRKILVDLLPSQQDANILCLESECWQLLHAMNDNCVHVSEPQKNGGVVSTTFDMFAVSKQGIGGLSKTLLYLAICIQQLPSEFDTSRLQLPTRIDLYESKIISTIQPLVTSDDEIVSTLEGLECLMLQGVYHTNSGNPKRAWLSFRRAINVAQLMGIHKSHDIVITSSKKLWYSIERADRYIALLLGLPSGSATIPFRPEENFQNPAMDKDILFIRKIVEVADLIIKRNENEDITTYATTQLIDEKLEILASEMPEQWWNVPQVIAPHHTVEAAMQVDHLFAQIWYLQLQGLLHLPFMLRSSKDRKYEYSRYVCLKSARALVHRYLALRYRNRNFCCKIIDFAPLTATITIFLGLLDPPVGEETRESKRQRVSDRNLVHTLLESMEKSTAGGSTQDFAVSKSVRVIKALLEIESSNHVTNSLRITVPYFGVINIARTLNDGKPSTELLSQKDTIPAQSQAQQDLDFIRQNGIHAAPMVHFSSSQFAPLPGEQSLQDWNLPDADTLFFDSLLNTDLEGNWLF